MLWCGSCPVHWAGQAVGCWQLRVQVHVMGVLITVLCGCATIRWLGCCWSLACLVDRSLRFHASEMCPVRCPAESVLLSGVATESFPYVFGAVCVRPYSVYSKAFSGRRAPNESPNAICKAAVCGSVQMWESVKASAMWHCRYGLYGVQLCYMPQQ